jgi:hypothetical protein
MVDSPIRLSLSAKGLQRLETVNHERNFTFIIGNDRYPCPSFIAEFLSPRIASLRSQDITIDELSIETADPAHHFALLLSVGFGREISISANELSFVRSVCAELGNFELFAKTLERESSEIPEDELKARMALLSAFDGRGDFEIPFVASHFYQFSVSDFDRLSVSALESILSDESLVVRDEDFVFDVIYRRASDDASYFRLLEFVRFEFVTVDCMKRAVDFIADSFEFLTIGVWSSLRTRLTLSVTGISYAEETRYQPLHRDRLKSSASSETTEVEFVADDLSGDIVAADLSMESRGLLAKLGHLA